MSTWSPLGYFWITRLYASIGLGSRFMLAQRLADEELRVIGAFGGREVLDELAGIPAMADGYCDEV